MCVLIASIPDLSILLTLNEEDIIQLLTSISVDIRIYLPEKVIFTSALRPR